MGEKTRFKSGLFNHGGLDWAMAEEIYMNDDLKQKQFKDKYPGQPPKMTEEDFIDIVFENSQRYVDLIFKNIVKIYCQICLQILNYQAKKCLI